MDDQAATQHIANATAHGKGAGPVAEPGNTLCVCAQADQITRMVWPLPMVPMGLALWIEMTTRAHAVPAGAIAFFVNVKTVHLPGGQAANFTFDHDPFSQRTKVNLACHGLAAGGLQLCTGCRTGQGVATALQEQEG